MLWEKGEKEIWSSHPRKLLRDPPDVLPLLAYDEAMEPRRSSNLNHHHTFSLQGEQL